MNIRYPIYEGVYRILTNFTRNALQSDEIKRGSPNLRLENQPAMAGTRPDKRQEEWIERGNAALQL